MLHMHVSGLWEEANTIQNLPGLQKVRTLLFHHIANHCSIHHYDEYILCYAFYKLSLNIILI